MVVIRLSLNLPPPSFLPPVFFFIILTIDVNCGRIRCKRHLYDPSHPNDYYHTFVSNRSFAMSWPCSPMPDDFLPNYSIRSWFFHRCFSSWVSGNFVWKVKNYPCSRVFPHDYYYYFRYVFQHPTHRPHRERYHLYLINVDSFR